MDISVIHRNRRAGGKDRRQNTEEYQGPERRSGKDRRKLNNRLNELIAQDKKEKSLKVKQFSPGGRGNVIRRRRNQADLRVDG